MGTSLALGKTFGLNAGKKCFHDFVPLCGHVTARFGEHAFGDAGNNVKTHVVHRGGMSFKWIAQGDGAGFQPKEIRINTARTHKKPSQARHAEPFQLIGVPKHLLLSSSHGSVARKRHVANAIRNVFGKRVVVLGCGKNFVDPLSYLGCSMRRIVCATRMVQQRGSLDNGPITTMLLLNFSKLNRARDARDRAQNRCRVRVCVRPPSARIHRKSP